MKRRNDVRLEQVAEGIPRNLLEWRRQRVSSAVDDNVDASEVSVDLVDESGHCGLVCDVEVASL